MDKLNIWHQAIQLLLFMVLNKYRKMRGKSSKMYLCLLFLWLTSCSGKSQKTWVEENGFVIIEAEEVCSSCLNDDGWTLETEPKGYSGSGYIKWMGSSLVGHDKEVIEYSDMPLDRKIIYKVSISKPGRYFWRLRNIHTQEDGDNDAFVSVNKGAFGKTYDWNENEFTWDETGNWATAVLGPGIINFEIAGRSNGFGIDRIAIFHEDLALPIEQWLTKGPYYWMDTCIWSKRIADASNL